MAVQNCLPWERPHARAPLAVRGDVEPGEKMEGGCSCFISDFPAVLLTGSQSSRLSRSPASTATARRPAQALPGAVTAAGGTSVRRPRGGHGQSESGPRSACPARRWSTTGWASATRRWWPRAVWWATPRQVGAGGRGCPCPCAGRARRQSPLGSLSSARSEPAKSR